MAITVLNMTLSAGYCCPGTHWRPLRRRVLGAHECPTWLGTPERKLDWFTGNFTRNPHINEKKQSGWWFQPLWKIWKPLGMMKFPTEWKNKIHVPNHQPDGKKKHGFRFRFSLPSNDERKKTWVSRQNWGIFGIENVVERWRIDLQVMVFLVETTTISKNAWSENGKLSLFIKLLTTNLMVKQPVNGIIHENYFFFILNGQIVVLMRKSWK